MCRRDFSFYFDDLNILSRFMADIDPTSAANTDPAKEPLDAGTYYRKQAAENVQHAQSAAETEQELLRNARYDAFFAPYHPQVREHFARGYAQRKLLWVNYGDFYARHLSGQLSYFENLAAERLWDIQHKKLFDLECRWRAEQLTLPAIETTYDFWPMRDRIENCPLLPAITETELDFYLQFVAQAPDFDEDVLNDGDDLGSFDEYSDYREWEADDDTGRELPAWYEFHNQRTGHGQLMRLPDVRGGKEERYMQAYGANFRAELEQKQRDNPLPPAPPHDPRPSWLYHRDEAALIQQFARQFEPIQVRQRMEAYETANQERSDDDVRDDDIQEAVDFLNDIHEPVPIEAGPDWRQALLKTVSEFKRRKLLEHLPPAYEAYVMREQVGIAHPQVHDKRTSRIHEALKKQVLDGRKLLGEPENFDF